VVEKAVRKPALQPIGRYSVMYWLHYSSALVGEEGVTVKLEDNMIYIGVLAWRDAFCISIRDLQ
jgi:hypothetical protein